MPADALTQFHPLVTRWFAETFGAPTEIQARAWKAIAEGRHVLLTAPTGSGKTLAAFLWALDRLITAQWPSGCTQVVYISPLKALNNDVRRNLLAPLQSLRRLFEANSQPFPHLTVATRSGDTTPSERRRMVRQPPEILITTPESLNLLLSSAGGRSGLTAIRSVIMDELHAILDSRRGTYLITAVERLTRLSGEFQRIALSATVRPLETASRFVGGYRFQEEPSQPRYIARDVTTLASEAFKPYALNIRQPGEIGTPGDPQSYWTAFAEQIKEHVRANSATLVFTNSRQLCEKLTFLLNRYENELLAYSHHGSLSREIRTEVEKKLKAGHLKAIVATNSLELGIDIGALDEVVLVQSPASVTEAVQRVGRAGHGVGETSRGTFYPSHAMDIVSAAVLVEAIRLGSIETVKPIAAPLDVLAQVMLSMCAFETCRPDKLYNFLRTAWPYHTLTRRQFDLVVNMLEGRYQQARLRELQPRMTYDRMDQTLATRKGTLLTLYTSGGVIPDRGYYGLRNAESGAKIGELDEEFVWEARVGQVFTLGTQNWRIQRITSSDVLVLPAARGKPAPPFWKAENTGRGFHLSEMIGRFMEKADADLEHPSFDDWLRNDHHLDGHALERLKTFLLRQRAHTGCALPHRHHLLIEYTTLGPGGEAGHQVVWHTLWGGRVNRPLAMAMEAACQEALGVAPQIYASNDGLSFVLPMEMTAEEMIGMVRADRLEELICKRLAGTGFFGARFRECAGRALLLPRQRVNMRMPLWLSRLRAQKLMAAISDYNDFPILAETWRTCLQDEFDLQALGGLLLELERGEITWTAVRTAFPSPLAQSNAWHPINTAMYQDDQGAAPHSGRLADDLLYEITLDPGLRPQIDPRAAAGFEAKRQRLAQGYAPDSAEELLDWIKERTALPGSEWRALQEAMVRDHGAAAGEFARRLADKLVCLRSLSREMDQDGDLILAGEMLPRWLSAFHGHESRSVEISWMSGKPLSQLELDGEPGTDEDGLQSPAAAILAEWIRFYGPRPVEAVSRMLGLPLEKLQPILNELFEARTLVSGPLLRQGDAHEICDRENLEILLRHTRKEAVPVFETLDAEALPLFLAQFQGLTQPGRTVDDLARRLDQLLAWKAPAGIWETDLLPARIAGYRAQWMDQLIQAGELRWTGGSGRKVLFCYEGELDLILAEDRSDRPRVSDGEPGSEGGCDRLFPDPLGRYPFSVLQQSSGLDAADLNERLWTAVWQGRVSNDAFDALRRGVETRFRMPEPGGVLQGVSGRSRSRRRPGRSAFQRWKAARSGIGNWYRLPYPDPSENPLDREERNKERARLLLDRYGLVFRELLAREAPMLQWAALFRALRLMELSGEVLAGQFFKGIQGLQFISPQAFHLLREGLHLDAVFWLNAVDPASICGLGLEAFQPALPRHLPGNHMVYHGTCLVVISRQRARHLQINVPADHPRLLDYLAFVHHMLTRPVRPLRQVRIETINEIEAVRQEGYLAIFKRFSEAIADPGGITLYPRHQPAIQS